MENVFDVPKNGGGGEVAEINLFHNNFFGTCRAQSEKVGQIFFRPPNFFLPVRPCRPAMANSHGFPVFFTDSRIQALLIYYLTDSRKYFQISRIHDFEILNTTRLRVIEVK